MKTGIEKISEWVQEKVREVNPNNPKFANKGSVALSKSDDWEDKMNSYVYTTLQLILQRFASDKGEVQIGHAKLTEASMTIGNVISQRFTDEDLPSYILLPIGDLFLGGFYSCGYIDIYRDANYSEWDSSAPYVIKATEKFLELAVIPEILEKDILRATTDRPIKNVSNMIQGHGRSVIKGYRDPAHVEDLTAAIEEDKIWLRSLNRMQQTGWSINTEVFEIIDRNFDSLLQEVGVRPFKGSSEAVNIAFKKLKKSDTKRNRNRYNKEMELWNKELEVLRAYSKNVESKVVYQKVKEMIKLGTFYQYVELDYRGRAYYQEPFMNYQGPDMSRGLLQFAEGKPLDDSGVRWLAIHTATSYNESYSRDSIPEWCSYDYKTMLKEQKLESISVDKMTLVDRERWTWENMYMIGTHCNSIQDCEKPIIYLACCIEWKNYTHDPRGHISKLPIPIDGSCNGYQHSGAIAKDEVTGSLVSLVDQEVQSDLYLKIAKALIKKLPAFFKARPNMKMKHIRKGIAKRGVMTRAYSAGKDAIAENMYKDCHVEGYTKEFNITMLDCVALADKLYDLISEECPGATKTMKYLQELAKYELGEFETHVNGKKISKAEKKKRHTKLQATKKAKEDTTEVQAAVDEMSSVLIKGNGSRSLNWTTSTEFIVRYHAYHTRSLKVQSTIPGYGRIKHVIQEDSKLPNASKFQAGISPNFIHSMDAAHMGLVINDWDGPFGGVHDSFSALAVDIDRLSKLTRNRFVDMYDEDDPYGTIGRMILSDGSIDLPETGKLEVSDVLHSRYFFS